MNYILTDYKDYMDVDVKNKTLIVYDHPIHNTGKFITTDKEYAAIHPKTMDEYIEKNFYINIDENKKNLRDKWHIEKIIRKDKCQK